MTIHRCHHRPENGCRKPGSIRSGGFTLLELVLVVVILGTLAGLVIPMWAGGMDGVRLGRGAEQVFAAAREARAHAALRGLRTRLVIDFEARSFRIEEEARPLEVPGEWTELPGLEEKPYVLPDGIVFAEARIGEASFTDGEALLPFRPDGATENALLVVATEDGDRRTIEVRGVTGRVRIVPDDETEQQ